MEESLRELVGVGADRCEEAMEPAALLPRREVSLADSSPPSPMSQPHGAPRGPCGTWMGLSSGDGSRVDVGVNSANSPASAASQPGVAHAPGDKWSVPGVVTSNRNGFVAGLVDPSGSQGTLDGPY